MILKSFQYVLNINKDLKCYHHCITVSSKKAPAALDQTSVQQPWYLSSAKNESRAKELKSKKKIYLDRHKGGKSEPAGLYGLSKQKGPVELGRKRKGNAPEGREGEGTQHAPERERASTESSILWGFTHSLKAGILFTQAESEGMNKNIPCKRT